LLRYERCDAVDPAEPAVRFVSNVHDGRPVVLLPFETGVDLLGAFDTEAGMVTTSGILSTLQTLGPT
jgi:hypothetical protein